MEVVEASIRQGSSTLPSTCMEIEITYASVEASIYFLHEKTNNAGIFPSFVGLQPWFPLHVCMLDIGIIRRMISVGYNMSML